MNVGAAQKFDPVRQHTVRADEINIVDSLKFDPAQVHPVKFGPDAGCNTTDEVILDQVRENIRRGLMQVRRHTDNDYTAVLVCGGPSLAETEKELVEAVWRGGKVVAVNGAYQWCIDHNIKPSAMVMIDAREFNARFLAQPVPGCKYLLASQCHPQTFELCRERETLIWHACGTGESEHALIKDYYFDHTYPVDLGTTVAIRAISLMRLLGFRTFEIFGLDSCWLDDRHHGYAQTENDGDGRVSLWMRPKGRDDKAAQFVCAAWHIKQCQDFMHLIVERGDMFRLNVHGRGLIATMMRTGAEISMED